MHDPCIIQIYTIIVPTNAHGCIELGDIHKLVDIHNCVHQLILIYLCAFVGNQNSIQKEIKSRLKLGNACYHSVQNLLSSSLLSKNLKIKTYRTIILPVVLYGCETWS